MDKEKIQTGQEPGEEEAVLNDGQVSIQEARIIKQIAQQRKARIVIPSGRDANERGAVPVGLNGREFLIVRDKEVDVPVGVLEVLNLAVANVIQSNGGEENGMTTRKAPRFPYRLIGYIDPATGELEKQ